MKKHRSHRLAKAAQRVRREAAGKPATVHSDKGPPATECRAVGRRAFAKISEVEGIRLSEEAENTFAEFDAQELSYDERRRAIIDRFKRTTR